MLYFDHETCRFLNSQRKLNSRHGNWVEFLQPYPYVIKHKAGVENKVTDALSRQVSILVAISNEVTGFERIKNDYKSCPDFGEVYKPLVDGLVRERDDYFLLDRYLFKANKLYIPRTSVRDFIIWKIHIGGMSGHYGIDKTIVAVT